MPNMRWISVLYIFLHPLMAHLIPLGAIPSVRLISSIMFAAMFAYHSTLSRIPHLVLYPLHHAPNAYLSVHRPSLLAGHLSIVFLLRIRTRPI